MINNVVSIMAERHWQDDEAGRMSIPFDKKKLWVILDRFYGCDILYYWHKRWNILRRFQKGSYGSLIKQYQSSVMVKEKPQRRTVYEAPFFESGEGEKYYYDSPAIYTMELKDAGAIGSTGLIINGNKAFYQPFDLDSENRCDFRFGPLKYCSDNGSIYVECLKREKTIEKAINLCGFASRNYYHFSVEIISKLAYIDSDHSLEETPLLIDSEIRQYPQMMEMLDIVKKKHPVVFMEYGEIIWADSLVVISMNTWMPINVRKESLFRISDCMIAESAIHYLRGMALPYMKEKRGKKVYLSRGKSHYQRLLNESEIKGIFLKHGYEVICPDDLSWKEQVALFSSARTIVSVTGAALTNWIYCRKKTVLGCIIPENTHFCIYSTIAKMIGGDCLFYSPDAVEYHGLVSQDQYRIRPERLNDYLFRLDLLGDS